MSLANYILPGLMYSKPYRCGVFVTANAAPCSDCALLGGARDSERPTRHGYLAVFRGIISVFLPAHMVSLATLLDQTEHK
jgi:hypothetical protein